MPATSMEKMQPIVHLTLSAKVYQDLRELIISGQLQPGARLTLAGMASALGTSSMPVREAINKLAADDALEILPNKSVRVPVMTKTRFRELVTIRLAVEGLAIETAAALITADQLTHLAELGRAFQTELQLAMPDVNRIIQVNKQFHFGAYTAAHWPSIESGPPQRIEPTEEPAAFGSGASRHAGGLACARWPGRQASPSHGHPVCGRRHSFGHGPENRLSQLCAFGAGITSKLIPAPAV
jgi:DNA-binding transcriptional regulator YhcF (GntR family)